MMFITRLQTERDEDHLWDYIIDNFEGMTRRDVVPLYVTKRDVQGETSLIVDATDLSALSDFIMTHLAEDETIVNIRVVNMMQPLFFPAPTNARELQRFTVNVCCRPKQCKEIYKEVSRIRTTDDIAITYISFNFMDCGNSLTLSVLSRDEDALETFLDQQVDSIQGAQTIDYVRIIKTRKLASLREWQKTIHPLTLWEQATSCDYDEEILRDVIAGC